ncbi:MAG: HD family phosphohydrolase [Armatimonadota bacterium]
MLTILLSMNLLPDKVDLQVGDISQEDIHAHRTVRYVDSVQTERMRQEALARVDRQYRAVPNAASEADEAVADVFGVLRRARVDPGLSSLQAKSRYVRHNLRLSLSDDSLGALLAADSNTFSEIESYCGKLVTELMSHEIRDDNDDVERARAEFVRRLDNHFGDAVHAKAAAAIGSRYITSNRIYDPELTESVQKRRYNAVSPQHRQIMAGELVIGRGERVTPEHLDKFTALGLRNPSIDYGAVLCIGLLVVAVVVLVTAYLARYQESIYRSNKHLLLLVVIVLLSVLGLRLGGSMLGLKLSGMQFGYFATSWITTAGMLIAMLLDVQLAVLLVAILATASGLAMSNDLRWAIGSLTSGLVAIYAVSEIRNRLLSDLVRAGLALCGVNLIMVWLIGRIGGEELQDMLVGSTWAVAGGAGSIALFALGTAVLEKPFGITTHNRLVELSDTHNPILKRLLMEAPGTYSHSIFVGNIAATAADVIGADALLVRVASYYHDIGKIKRPQFFVENQYVENIHDKLNPTLSALVIRSHIKDGMDLAKEYKLPPLLYELISQHHGTSLVRYFYSQAAMNAPNGAAALEQQFRYEGTKPQTKEAALLMLADAVEAASRALPKPTPGQIEDMVEAITHDKLQDGQLDESELTFKDISRIKNSFVRTLTSMMHARIEYPDLPTSEVKRAIGSGNSGKEPAGREGEPGKTDSGREQVPSP